MEKVEAKDILKRIRNMNQIIFRLYFIFSNANELIKTIDYKLQVQRLCLE